MIVAFLLILGVAFIAIGVRGKAEQAGEILADDLSGRNSFVPWIAAVMIVAVVASYGPFRRVGVAFYGLMLVVLFLSNDGFFDKFRQQIME